MAAETKNIPGAAAVPEAEMENHGKVMKYFREGEEAAHLSSAMF